MLNLKKYLIVFLLLITNSTIVFAGNVDTSSESNKYKYSYSYINPEPNASEYITLYYHQITSDVSGQVEVAANMSCRSTTEKVRITVTLREHTGAGWSDYSPISQLTDYRKGSFDYKFNTVSGREYKAVVKYEALSSNNSVLDSRTEITDVIVSK